LKLMREYAPVPRRSATVPGSTYFIPQSLESTHSPNPESRLAFLTCMCAYNCVRFRCVCAFVFYKLSELHANFNAHTTCTARKANGQSSR
jgi:hypothetical protein